MASCEVATRCAAGQNGGDADAYYDYATTADTHRSRSRRRARLAFSPKTPLRGVFCLAIENGIAEHPQLRSPPGEERCNSPALKRSSRA